MGLFAKTRQLAKNIKSATRFREIVLVFARHGFQDILKKANVNYQILDRLHLKSLFGGKHLSHFSVAQRLRMSFEELGPTFVKLGQLLSTRPDLIPHEWAEELKKLQDQVQPVDYEDLQGVLLEHFGSLEDVFASFDQDPMASASMSQVHRAVLKDGQRDVVVKIRRPGIPHIIENDLNVLYVLAGLFERYIPESRIYNPRGIVDEFFRSMELETDFLIEANNMLRFQRNFDKDSTVKIPQVFLDLSSQHILVLERVNGLSLSHPEVFEQEGIDSQQFLKSCVAMFVKMVFHDCFFHGDLHAGNIFVLPDHRIGLVDFGVAGRLGKPVKEAIANMCIALACENYDRLAYEFVALAPYDERTNVDRFARQLMDLIAPYFGMSHQHLNTGQMLMKATGLAAQNHLQVPAELVMFFKAIVTIDGVGHQISDHFDLMQEITKNSKDILKSKYNLGGQLKDLQYFAEDTLRLVEEMPRQTRQMLRKVSSPHYKFPIEVEDIKRLRRSIETSSKLFFLGLIISGVIVASSIALFEDRYASRELFGLPLLSGIGFLSALCLSLLAFYNYIKK